MIGGYVTVGPNAVLSIARAEYVLNIKYVGQMLAFSGFWRTTAANMKTVVQESGMSVLTPDILTACQRQCPTLELDELERHPAGLRLKAVMADGTLAHDFLIRNTARTVHVCNAPFPAATSTVPIAEHNAAVAADVFSLNAGAASA